MLDVLFPDLGYVVVELGVAGGVAELGRGLFDNGGGGWLEDEGSGFFDAGGGELFDVGGGDGRLLETLGDAGETDDF